MGVYPGNLFSGLVVFCGLFQNIILFVQMLAQSLILKNSNKIGLLSILDVISSNAMIYCSQKEKHT